MSLEKYSIFDILIEGVQIIDFEGRYVYLNEEVGRQGRIAPSLLIGQSMVAVYPGIEKTELYQLIQACLNERKAGKMLNQFYYRDGSFGWFELRLQPVDEGVLIFSSDVTARKQLEAELQNAHQELEEKMKQKTNELTSLHGQLNIQLEHRIEQIQTEISDYKHALDESCIVAITDQKGTIKHVNDNFCKISGFAREELLGQDHRIINSGYHPRSFIRELWITIAQGNIWRGEIKNKAKDGSYYWVDTTIVPFLDEMGKPYQYLAIRNDITGRKLAEEQLLRTNEHLEMKVRDRTLELTQALEREKELSDMKSRFVSMASHEFRTPLSAILSSTSLVEHYTHPDVLEKRNKHLERIRSSVKNLTNILDDFLSLEKLDQGKVETYAAEFDLKETLLDAMEEIDGIIKRRRQTIHFFYEGANIVGQDKKILKNILLNLLTNASKYSADDKMIRLRAETREGSIRIDVADEGIGIPREAQDQLFEKFFRAHNAHNIQGTGLGLNIVKRYVEILQGSIEFISEENVGTTFTVHLPMFRES